MAWKDLLLSWLERRSTLWMLLVINVLGSVYGFYWYKNQIAATDPKLVVFVPDSPMASTFFSLVLLLWLFGRRSPLLEALASITLFKYGIWAVVIILWTGLLDPRPFLEALTWQHWMLMGSHLGMAVEAVLFAPFFTYGKKQISIAATWTLLNDGMDYGMDTHPWWDPVLDPFYWWIGAFTLVLSGVSILLFSILSMLDSKRRKRDLPLLFSAGR